MNLALLKIAVVKIRTEGDLFQESAGGGGRIMFYFSCSIRANWAVSDQASDRDNP
jgi:hypothetical protein